MAYETRAELAGKIEWEGGLLEALDYGLTAADVPAGDTELLDAWKRLDDVWGALQEPMDAVLALLPEDTG